MTTDDDRPPLTPEEQRLADRGAAIVAAAAALPEAQAPASLREAIARDAARRPARRSPAGPVRARLALAAAALAVLATTAVLAVGGGSPAAGPTVTQVAAVGRLPATRPAPAPVGGRPPRLGIAVGGLSFPDWEEPGWRATGSRTDRLEGRRVTTVSYVGGSGARLGYSIVAGEPIGGVPAGRDIRVGGTRYRVARRAGRTTVTWVQAGHTCVLGAPGVPAARLVDLASWSTA